MASTSIRNQIRLLRFQHGEMTQGQLAERIGVTRQTIAAIEKCKYAPSLEAAFRIAAVFDVPLDRVFEYESADDRDFQKRRQKPV
ncbi:MAG: helix-turn-helix transcriptional regulator [Alphaproteobacteria bacterium]|jgi:putative transcriptional regulator|nr:helix-turn-helix transcriptional regulator [Alphaproteobacteria bacterium]